MAYRNRLSIINQPSQNACKYLIYNKLQIAQHFTDTFSMRFYCRSFWILEITQGRLSKTNGHQLTRQMHLRLTVKKSSPPDSSATCTLHKSRLYRRNAVECCFHVHISWIWPIIRPVPKDLNRKSRIETSFGVHVSLVQDNWCRKVILEYKSHLY